MILFFIFPPHSPWFDFDCEWSYPCRPPCLPSAVFVSAAYRHSLLVHLCPQTRSSTLQMLHSRAVKKFQTWICNSRSEFLCHEKLENLCWILYVAMAFLQQKWYCLYNFQIIKISTSALASKLLSDECLEFILISLLFPAYLCIEHGDLLGRLGGRCRRISPFGQQSLAHNLSILQHFRVHDLVDEHASEFTQWAIIGRKCSLPGAVLAKALGAELVAQHGLVLGVEATAGLKNS